jgi:putative membrane protein
MDHMMGGGWGIAMMLGMGLLWLLLLAAIVAGVVWVARRVWDRAGETRRTRAGNDTPLDTLRRRYAAGELSRDEFERMRRELAEP